ncbi:MAG: serine--tRNA ligase [Anaerolineales bacterium]|nr:serine--tRNA ligase [Anaerolineales bacterium]
MLDIQAIREEPEAIIAALTRRGIEAPIEAVLERDLHRRKLLTEVENLKAERNQVSKQIGKMKDAQARNEKINEMREVGTRIESLDLEVRMTEEALQSLMLGIPNLPQASVPDGPDESANVIVKSVGEIPSYDFDPQPHWDLGPALGIMDFDRGVKITGSRFYVLSGAGAQLQRALIAWMLDLHHRQGYLEKYTPFMVKSETLFAAGQLPKFQDNLYHDHEEDLWLVPTAEVPLTGLHINEILEPETLPRHYTAYTPCFRREKMSAGRDVRGIKRGHQFDKVEMYTYCLPDESDAELERMRKHAEETCSALGLTYRVLELCTGDLGFSARKTFDIEVWAAGCGEWLEISSVSNCGDFQARRANARFRPAPGENTRFLHTLNGSGLGLPRTLIAVLENYQQADGTVVVPEVLRPWMGGVEIISPEGDPA